MSDGTTDDSNITSGKPAIEELTRSSCSTARVVLAFLTVPMFLYYLGSPFAISAMIDTDNVWVYVSIFVWALVFVIAYVVTLFRKMWGHVVCAIYAFWWIVQPFILLNQPGLPDGEGPPFEGLYVLVGFVICGMIVFYATVILVLNVVVALSSWRDRRKMN
jgi:hypothetical protein